MASVGFGSIVTMIILNRFKHFNEKIILVGVSILLIGIAFGGFGFLPYNSLVIIPVLLGLVAGVGGGISMIISNYTIQTEPHEKEVSRIAGIFQSMLSMTVFVSPALGTLLIQMTSVQTAFIVSGGLLVISACLAFYLNKSKQPKSEKLIEKAV
ncbi:MFS transporter [Alkalihalobacillus sp. 1P02AB]|uniref:MFS transporter n=1 Tax=Alkalihalobacillus sp. 1P02AB TaxID=3132260 RepID=UPI0039A736F5